MSETMYDDIVEQLPYKSSFRFVDHISSLTEEGVTGDYTLKKDAFFYADHFVGNPVTPGVILTEIMAQIGLVVLGIFLAGRASRVPKDDKKGIMVPLLTSTDISFYKMVLPGEKVTVNSHKQYFRFNKLKCLVEMFDEKGDLVARGSIAGFIKQVGHHP